MINTEVKLTQDELRYLIEHMDDEGKYAYLKAYFQVRLSQIVEMEGYIEPI